jgi:transposase
MTFWWGVQKNSRWGRLKEWRAVATRYEKTAASFMGVLCLAASLDWLRR